MKIKLVEQFVRCMLDDKLSKEQKFRKMDYIIRLGVDINASVKENGFSILTFNLWMEAPYARVV